MVDGSGLVSWTVDGEGASTGCAGLVGLGCGGLVGLDCRRLVGLGCGGLVGLGCGGLVGLGAGSGFVIGGTAKIIDCVFGFNSPGGRLTGPEDVEKHKILVIDDEYIL
jgi:hypothetical protein